MKLQTPVEGYSRPLMIEWQRQIEAADRLNQKAGRPIEVGQGQLILTDTVDGTRYEVTVASGVLTVTAL